MERTGAMVNVNGVTMPAFQVSYMTSLDKNLICSILRTRIFPKARQLRQKCSSRASQLLSANLQLSGRKVEQVEGKSCAEGDKAPLRSGQTGAFCKCYNTSSF